ncbi:putative Methyltransf_11 domain-containing protein [Gammaproteobacteria bacterium]
MNGLAKIKQLGLMSFFLAMFERLRNTLLQRRFGFDLWHISGTYHARPYKALAVGLVNDLKPKCVLDVGGGLGDIISRVQAKQRILADASAEVLAASVALHGDSVVYVKANFAQLPEALAALPLDRIDVLIMINWPHNLDFAEIHQGLAAIKEKLPIRYLLTDLMYWQTEQGFHRHSASQYQQVGEVLKLIDGQDGARNLLLSNSHFDRDHLK